MYVPEKARKYKELIFWNPPGLLNFAPRQKKRTHPSFGRIG